MVGHFKTFYLLFSVFVNHELWRNLSNPVLYKDKQTLPKCRPETIQHFSPFFGNMYESVLKIERYINYFYRLTDHKIPFAHIWHACIELCTAVVFLRMIKYSIFSLQQFHEWLQSSCGACSSGPCDAEESWDERRKVGVVITHSVACTSFVLFLSCKNIVVFKPKIIYRGAL